MAKTRYHVNPETGKTGQCSATVKGCQFAKDGMIPEHYDSEDDARKAYEQQNEENTFKNNVKSTADDVNKIDLKDAAKNYSDAPSGNSLRTNYDPEYADTLLKGRNLDEIIINFNNEYDRLKDSPRSTEEEYYKKVIDNEGLEYKYGIISRGEYDYTPYIDIKNNVLQLSTYSAYYDNDVPNPLPKKLVDDIEYENETDYRDDDGIVESHMAKTTIFSYKISDEDKEKLDNERHFKTISEYKRVIDDPTMPNWMILPDQKNAFTTKERGITRYNFNKPFIARENYGKAKNQLESAIAAGKKAKEVEKSLEEEKDKLKKLDKFIEKNKDKSITSVLNTAVEAQKKNVNNVERDLKKLQKNSSPENIKKLKEKFNKSNEAAEVERNQITEMNLGLLQNDLASKYPSTDANERENAAKKWIENNKDNLPDMINYNNYRSETFGYYL